MRVRSGVDFAHANADTCRYLDLRELRIDEHAGDDAGIDQALHDAAQARFLPATSSPPSVVISSRPSGTSIAISGLSAQAMLTISSVAAISRLSLMWTSSRKR